MLYSIKGKLVHIQQTDAIYQIAVECESGITFELKTTMATAKKCQNIGEMVKLYTYFAMRENNVDIFGFYDQEEKNSFKMLISVSGVGPSFALLILSSISPAQLAICIASGDSKTLTQCKGIGAKTAQRIILELKDKIGNIEIEKSEGALDNVNNIDIKSDNFAEAISALVVLGYSRVEASKAVSAQPKDRSAQNLIKEALKLLAVN